MATPLLKEVDAFMLSRGVSTSTSQKPARIGDFQRKRRVEQSAEQLTSYRARERELAALLALIAQGDQLALATLYDETCSLVYGLAVRVLQDQSAAEDVTIEVYSQAYRQASSYDPGRGTPSAWLLTLARSRAIDRLRAESQRRKLEVRLEAVEAIPSLADDPEEQSSAAELRRLVQKALAALAPEQRQVIEIAYYSGLSHSEIAARVGQPLGTVKTRIRTGMILLRDHLRPLLAEEQS